MNEYDESNNTNPFNLPDGHYHSPENVYQREQLIKHEKMLKNQKLVQKLAIVMCACAAVAAVAVVLGVNLPAPIIVTAICCAFGGGYLINTKKPAREA